MDHNQRPAAVNEISLMRLSQFMLGSYSAPHYSPDSGRYRGGIAVFFPLSFRCVNLPIPGTGKWHSCMISQVALRFTGGTHTGSPSRRWSREQPAQAETAL